jgi:hypothetical protein
MPRKISIKNGEIHCQYCSKTLKNGSKSIFCDSRCRIYQNRYYKGQSANPYQTYSLESNNIYVQELIKICNTKNQQYDYGNSIAEQTLNNLKTGHYGKINQGQINYLCTGYGGFEADFRISNLF